MNDVAVAKANALFYATGVFLGTLLGLVLARYLDAIGVW